MGLSHLFFLVGSLALVVSSANVSPGVVSNCGSANNGIMVCDVQFSVTGQLAGNVYPSRFIDNQLQEYEPAFSNSMVSLVPLYSVGGVYQNVGIYSGASYTSFNTCTCVNCSLLLTTDPTPSGNFAYGIYPRCQSVGSGVSSNPLANLTYYVNVTVSDSGTRFNVWQQEQVLAQSLFNVSYVLSGLTGQNIIDFEHCSGAPFSTCAPNFPPTTFANIPHVFGNVTSGGYVVLNASLYSDPRYRRHFFGRDWLVHFATNYNSVGAAATNAADFCEYWDGTCVGTQYTETFRPVLELDKSHALALDYPLYSFVDATPYGYPGAMALVSNATNYGTVTFTMKDHFQMSLPIIRLESVRVECSQNITTVVVVNSGVAADVSVGITLSGGTYFMVDYWAAVGVSSFVYGSDDIARICMVGACVDIKSSLLCPGGVDLPGPSGSTTATNGTTEFGVASSGSSSLSNTTIYIIAGGAGFCVLLLAAAVVACVVMRRKGMTMFHFRGQRVPTTDELQMAMLPKSGQLSASVY